MSITVRFGSPPPTSFDVGPTDEDVAFFEENGYLVVPRLTSDEELEWLSHIYAAVFDEPDESTYNPGAEPGDTGPALLNQSFLPELRFPELLGTTYIRNARRFASALLGVAESALSSWGHMIRKLPGAGPAPWHQDEAYWEPELDYHALAAWLPLHDVTVDQGCMQFVPGSHQRGLLPHRHVGNPAANLLEAPAADVSNAVACPLPAGGATFHHFRTLHYTAPNTTQRPRLAYPVEFQLPPVRREVPADRPWVYDFRRATGKTGPGHYAADGVVLPYP